MTIKTYEPVEQTLARVHQDTPAVAVEHVRGMIDSNAQLAAAGYIDERREKREHAGATVETLRARLMHQNERLQEVERKREATPVGHVLRAVLFLTGAAACIVTEATLSLSLPYLLNVPERSFMGLMMGVAMASAVLILDYVADRLGFTTSPGELLRSTIPSRFWRVTACAVSIAALLAVAGLNLYTISTITPTREEAAKLRHNIASADEPPMPVDEAKVSRAVFWFSISVTIGAALLLVVGASDARRVGRRGVLSVRGWLLNRTRHQVAEELNRAAAVLAARQAEWEQAPADAAHAADLVRADHLVRLEQALVPKQRARPSALEVIDHTFRAGRSAGAA
jgi:hypothetical protein